MFGLAISAIEQRCSSCDAMAWVSEAVHECPKGRGSVAAGQFGHGFAVKNGINIDFDGRQFEFPAWLVGSFGPAAWISALAWLELSMGAWASHAPVPFTCSHLILPDAQCLFLLLILAEQADWYFHALSLTVSQGDFAVGGFSAGLGAEAGG